MITAAVVVAGAAAFVAGRGVPGRSDAVVEARDGLRVLGYEPVGRPEVVFEDDQPLIWALERSLPGPGGVALARGRGGAVRWRVRFAGGGEAAVTAGGMLWSTRRPVPTDTGPNLYPAFAQAYLRQALRHLVSDSASWQAIRRQSWREGAHIWHRTRYVGGPGGLPPGWRRELDVEMVGSTIVTLRRAVQPLGTDMGVVMGRVRELDLLRLPALVGMAIVLAAVLVAGAEGWAYHTRLAPGRGLAMGALVALLGWVAGVSPGDQLVTSLTAAAVVTVVPLWRQQPPAPRRWGAVAGVPLAMLVATGPTVVAALGGWMPASPVLAANTSPLHMISTAWLPALVEEPLLRGALPGLVQPLVGWWGGALAGGVLGTLLHGVPAVPLVASLAVEMVLQVGLILLARAAGVSAAVLARGTAEVLLRRSAYPGGQPWDAAAMGVVLCGAAFLLWPRRQR